MSESNQVKWVGIRPTNPAEDIPVTLDGEGIVLEPHSGSSIIIKQGLVNNSTNTIHTVAAGKSLYLQSCWANGVNRGSGHNDFGLLLKTSGGAIVGYLFVLNLSIEQHATNSQFFSPPLIIPSLYYFQAYSGLSNLIGHCGIIGYEV